MRPNATPRRRSFAGLMAAVSTIVAIVGIPSGAVADDCLIPLRMAMPSACIERPDEPGAPDDPSPGGAGVVDAAPIACPINWCGLMQPTQGTDKCGWWQMYEIDATITAGDGSATVEVACGGNSLSCTVSTSGSIACHNEFVEGPGDFVCRVVPGTVKGNPTVEGSCKDPANPAAVYNFLVKPYTGAELPR